MRDVLVSIGGGAGQLPLIEAARAQGLGVVVVDQDPRAPGASLADGRVVASTHDPDAILRGLRPLLATRRVRAVATKSSGAPVAAAARIARELGLAGLDVDLARESVTKTGQRAAARRAGVRAPLGATARSEQDLQGLDLPWPRVVKPALTRVGKAGVSRVDTPGEERAAFAAAAVASGNGEVEVEEHVPGDDVVLAALFSGSELHPIALLDETARFDACGRARGLGFALPSVHGMGVLAQVVGAAQRLVHRTRAGDGVGFFSFRVAPGAEPCLIEVHFDLAGDFVADRLFRASTSYDPIRETLRLLAGEPWTARPARLAPAGLRFLFADELARDAETVLARLRTLRGVRELVLAPPAAGGGPHARVGYALLGGCDAAEVAEVGRRVDEVLGRGPLAGAAGEERRARPA